MNEHNINDIAEDFIDENNPPGRNHRNDTEDAENIRQHQESIVRSIPFTLWKKIESWGRDTGMLQSPYSSTASDIAYKIRNRRKLLDSDISRGYSIYETVWQYNPELLEEADELAAKDRETDIAQIPSESGDITLELIRQMVDWDKRKRILDDWNLLLDGQ